MAVMFVRNNQNRNLGSTNESALARRNERLQKQAMKKAMKVVSDAWAGERKIDQDVAGRRQNNKQRIGHTGRKVT